MGETSGTNADTGTESGTGTGAPSDVAEMSFEAALAELRRIVERLEKGEGALDEAIEAYERGARLKQHCEAKLREAEAKIEKIRVREGEAPQSEPLDQT